MAAGIPSLKTSGGLGRHRAAPWLTRRAVQAAAAASSTSSNAGLLPGQPEVAVQEDAGLGEQGPALDRPGPGDFA